MTKIGVLASHNGSGFIALHEAIKGGIIDAKIELVISNNTNANVINSANEFGIAALVINSKFYPGLDLDELIFKLFREKGCEYILLSGYMKKIGKILTDNFKVVNSHPALLPKFGGNGMYGRYVHEAVLESGDKTTGCTIHYVNENYDEGEIILQNSLNILENESIESLENRVKELEQKSLIEAFTKLLR